MKVATTVGIRELKDRAAELVRRAAAGERIVVARHGKPRAVLVPLDAVQTAASPRAEAWQRERDAFLGMRPSALARHDGRWVAVCGGRVVSSDTDLDRLSERMARRLRGRTFFVARVGHPPALVEMPGFEIE